MQPTLCSRCKKNVAVIFITRIENGESHNEGLCLRCARELHIKPVDEMMEKLGIADADLDNLTGDVAEMLGSMGMLGGDGAPDTDADASDADTDEDDVPWETGTVIDVRMPQERAVNVHTEVVEGQKCLVIPLTGDESARINGVEVDFTGEYNALIVVQQDKPGVVAHITKILSDRGVNIAFMRLFREEKGHTAYTIVESDERLPEGVDRLLLENPNIRDVMVVQQ